MIRKQNVYTIQDDIFLDALEIVSLNFKDIPYALVGGAVQVYVPEVRSILKSVNKGDNYDILAELMESG